ncbi:Gfo/Idh/MocA family protein [Puniceicoccus vermicola]|uniref:Gfo/Idh/MocA family oxidoreductase n=1 Tax=Puniceicoccus vermicola TaxID=388746 RepID=A0A7X1AZQ3_9BACT|nr:Gfo/Idh/MocA family oxidoreductase [Puniceicoccus vermicola]MBC2602769.1 Gfo/Idh/MocA family oxidoreductase [Puniceicoccus vermicola]
MTKQIGIGIIGCGNISQAYFNGAKLFEVLKVVSCADLNREVATAKAEENNCKAETVEELLANPEVQLVINLTVPSVHAQVSLSALNAGKHVHSEKPLSVSLEEAGEVLETAEAKGLLVGCAPDTFMGGGLQTCRKLVDDGWLGRVTSGSAFLMSRGPESWHPNPSFFYQMGAGPMFDMGPYYITALIHLLGPVKRVSAVATKAFEERIATCKQEFGKLLPVEVPTHYSGVLEFHSGAVINMVVSFDVCAHGHSPIEIYGTEGSLKVPDPNTFDGPVSMWTRSTKEWQTQAYSHPYRMPSRSIGAADLAYAILSDGKHAHRASGALAYHALEVMHSFEAASKSAAAVEIQSRPPQPAPLPLGIIEGRL